MRKIFPSPIVIVTCISVDRERALQVSNTLFSNAFLILCLTHSNLLRFTFFCSQNIGSKPNYSMKFYLSILVALTTTAPCVNSFQNYHRPSFFQSHKTISVTQRQATAAEETAPQTVTKEDLLGARDEIDRLLREKSCGMLSAFIRLVSDEVSIVALLRDFFKTEF